MQVLIVCFSLLSLLVLSLLGDTADAMPGMQHLELMIHDFISLSL